VGIAAGLARGARRWSASAATAWWRASPGRCSSGGCRSSGGGRTRSGRGGRAPARRLVAVVHVALAAYVVGQAVAGLAAGEGPEPSPVGIGLGVASLATMWLLARAKRARARQLHSHALEADATQTDICWQLSAVMPPRPGPSTRPSVGGGGRGRRPGHGGTHRSGGPGGVGGQGLAAEGGGPSWGPAVVAPRLGPGGHATHAEVPLRPAPLGAARLPRRESAGGGRTLLSACARSGTWRSAAGPDGGRRRAPGSRLPGA